MDWLQIDDPVSAVPVHGFCGFWGLIMCGLLSHESSLGGVKAIAGILKGGPWSYFGYQVLAAVTITAWAATTAFFQVNIYSNIDILIPADTLKRRHLDVVMTSRQRDNVQTASL